MKVLTRDEIDEVMAMQEYGSKEYIVCEMAMRSLKTPPATTRIVEPSPSMVDAGCLALYPTMRMHSRDGSHLTGYPPLEDVRGKVRRVFLAMQAADDSAAAITQPSFTSVGRVNECDGIGAYFQADHLGGGWVCTDPKCSKHSKK